MKNLTLEISLKPFYGLNREGVREVCDRALRQWHALVERAEVVSIMFWAADGSEILDYTGDLDAEMEWARYLGNANPHLHPQMPGDPEGKSLHAGSYPYREGAKKITYRRYAEIIAVWREAVTAIGKPVRIGLTFDPGGEFSPSTFKYERHPEVCLANTMGKGSFVCCYGVLNADDRPYAGFPGGIPQGTTMGTFLGRQFQHLADDLHADFIWLSNGFGFGMETWKTVGPLFDGETFEPESAPAVRDKILGFWQDFRKECPKLGIATRGTNLGTATDLASDATPLREIYEGDFDMLPPPNSPWAALNGDFGIEIAGYLSRIVELPAGKPALFRFYLHDIWWLNSPWLDRYEGQPHDIYLPMAACRITDQGEAETPETLNLLSIDDSYGRMPDAVPNESTPHLLRAWDERPDAAGPIVWLYPFDQVHDAMFTQPQSPERLFHTDWFVREVINSGLPVSTVISTRAFAALGDKKDKALAGRLLLSPAPFDTETEQQLLDWVEQGGNALVYGPLSAAPHLRERLGLEEADSLVGTVEVLSKLPDCDTMENGQTPSHYEHRPIMSAGGLQESPLPGSTPDVVARLEEQDRVLVSHYNTSSGGQLWWLRGPLPLAMEPENHLPVPDAPATTFPLSGLVRRALAELGWSIGFRAGNRSQRLPVLGLHRHDNGWFFSGYTPDTTVEFNLKTPYGAPLLLGIETRLREGIASFHQQRGWRKECRVFIDQAEGVASAKESTPGQVGVTRRMWVHGLDAATVRFFPPTGANVTAWHNPLWPFISGTKLKLNSVQTPQGLMLETDERVSGTILFSW
ncbi:MAG: hypothetical protein Q7Q73_01570 [Verrucomicrobiota bacterium JB024]|nr:hypothetical protein [Verrucomicrobiota bacterium JB024]